MAATIRIPLNILENWSAGCPGATAAILPGQYTFQCGISPNHVVVQWAVALPGFTLGSLATNGHRLPLERAPFNFLGCWLRRYDSLGCFSRITFLRVLILALGLLPR